ncbi:MerR family transcriptional regulator [Aquibacillus rhizosphaerae]|uniref:MerR family transcriptional regulator n=1 Tax=Aquibacillus rhizosphaerae TaxID=3051431 RepID=A0ABT7LCH8_9BACI|nr:MerR family transcriptional regulator [Aquibacillus sp. LR5S19]MDL4843139.1 MerR family transcriptional regulator [Aquibacillus sp. LR5S19]
MVMKIKEVADIVGISVRTLHHYDEIGLLKPKTNNTGYRLYSEDDLELLQQIMFFKELGFPLKKIKEIINNPSFDRKEALEVHRNMLVEKRSRLDKMIEMINKTIQHVNGEVNMTNKEKFEGFDFSYNPYEKEARERWGDKAVDNSNVKIDSLSDNQQKLLSNKMNEIYRNLANLLEYAPESDKTQKAIKEWYDFLNNETGHHYSLEAFKGLGQIYVADERFTENIDKFGEGLAVYMCNAMEVFADRNKQ